MRARIVLVLIVLVLAGMALWHFTRPIEGSLEVTMACSTDGALYLNDELIGTGDVEIVITDPKAECYPGDAFPVLKRSEIAFREAVGIDGKLLRTSPGAVNWQVLEFQRVEWQRADGSLDTFIVCAFEDPRDEQRYCFLLRARHADGRAMIESFSSSASRDGTGWWRKHWGRSERHSLHNIGSVRFSTPERVAEFQQRHSATKWWLDRFPQGATTLKES